MKKIFLLISFLAISTNSFANTEREGFYLKGGVGVNKLGKINYLNIDKIQDEYPENSYIDRGLEKSKSKFSPMYSIGFGYYIDDIFRTDLTVDYSVVEFAKATGITEGTCEGVNISSNNTIKTKANASSVMVNAYADFNVSDDISVFLGGGVGAAQIKEKVNLLCTVKRHDNDDIAIMSDSTSTKPKTNFAYSLTLGASHKITDNAHIELAYSWRDYGKTHPKLDDDDEGEKTHDSHRYRGHHIGVGLRFDI